MDEEDNLIKFPKSYKLNESFVPTTKEEVDASISMIKQSYFDMVSIELASNIFSRASMCGFNVSKQDAIKDCILVVESIKSLLMKTKGEYYSIQELADNIKYEDGSEDDIYINDDAYLDD